VVLEGTIIPPRSFVAGVPASLKGPIPPAAHARLRPSAAGYVKLAREHAQASDAR
jgi:carbonic anhydrase/acetyltransferase-like protein (isoleucine patch superfamily)